MDRRLARRNLRTAFYAAIVALICATPERTITVAAAFEASIRYSPASRSRTLA